MLLNGLYLTLLVGRTIPVPASASVVQELDTIEVTYDDSLRSGFQISFWLGRAGQTQVMDYPLLASQVFTPFNRLILVVTFGAKSQVLMDGIITHLQILPSNQPGASKLQVTGEDVSLMMDLTDRKQAFENQADPIVVGQVLASLEYGQYGLVPMISPIPASAVEATQELSFQDGTDLAFLVALAKRYGYVFYVIPGLTPGSPVPAVGTNAAYWGPRIRTGPSQAALSVNQGPTTNVDSIHFTYNALSPVTVTGAVQDRVTNTVQQVSAQVSDEPSLSLTSATTTQAKVRKRWLGATSGLSFTEAQALAQGKVDDAASSTVVAEGQLDTLRYGSLLQARRLVGVRGAGATYDGNYYVKRVTHSLALGNYKQAFTLLRQGIGATSPRVTP